jgi:hypothetical protein
VGNILCRKILAANRAFLPVHTSKNLPRGRDDRSVKLVLHFNLLLGKGKKFFSMPTLHLQGTHCCCYGLFVMQYIIKPLMTCFGTPEDHSVTISLNSIGLLHFSWQENINKINLKHVLKIRVSKTLSTISVQC